MSKKFETQWFYAGLDKRTEIQPSGFLGLKKEIVSIHEAKVANLDQFSEQLALIYNEFDENGYDVVNVVPISMVISEPCHSILDSGRKNYLGETGFSITRGAVVVGKRRD
jgi:hypothetical protein